MKIIIIGATTGIGRSLAQLYASKGYEISITGRRIALLDEIKEAFPNTKVHIRAMDVTDYEASRKTMEELVNEMGGVDISIINAGVGFPKASFEQEIETININVRGFMALAHWSYQYFQQKGGGQVVGVSSLAALSGSAYSPEYHASKAFMVNYMSGLRMRSVKYKHNITVTDIRPGFVDTPMTKQNKGMFWVATPEKAALQIAEAIDSKKKIAYITKRYILVAIMLKIIPEWLLTKVF